MFQRANKIVITESSATRRSHPAVGDTGYLNNMYFFFVDRFILLDMFFFRYKSDIKKNKTRCERKKFIIDLGMKKVLKRKLKVYGIQRRFFLENKYVINLTVVGHTIYNNPDNNPNLELIELPGINSLWYNHCDKAGNSRSKSLTKIPYGHIALAPNRKKSIQSEGSNALRCWAGCLIPLIESSIIMWPTNDLPDVSFNGLVSKIYRKTLSRYVHSRNGVNGPTLSLNKNVPACFGSMGKRHIIMDMQMIYAMSRSFLNNCDSSVLKNAERTLFSSVFSSVWKNENIMAAYDYGNISTASAKTLTGLFFRSIIMAGDTKSKLLNIGKNNIIPWSYEKIQQRAKKFEDIKRAADFGSAALNRIFEEDLLS